MIRLSTRVSCDAISIAEQPTTLKERFPGNGILGTAPEKVNRMDGYKDQPNIPFPALSFGKLGEELTRAARVGFRVSISCYRQRIDSELLFKTNENNVHW